MEKIIVKLLGVRGAAPISGEKYTKYGGATSCVLVQIGGENILFDAGTGLLSIRKHLKHDEKSVHILLSHPHLDHLEGLPSCPLLFEKGVKTVVYATPHGELSAAQQVEALLSPPLWPVGLTAFAAALSFYDILSSSFFIGEVRVDTMSGSHPGGCTMFRLTYKGKSIVYATDFEQDMGANERLFDFAKDCNLFLCDGEYTQEEFLQKRGFGHSTWNFAAQTGASCGAVQTKIIHHSLFREDKDLDNMQESIPISYPNCSFARSGEEITL